MLQYVQHFKKKLKLHFVFFAAFPELRMLDFTILATCLNDRNLHATVVAAFVVMHFLENSKSLPKNQAALQPELKP